MAQITRAQAWCNNEVAYLAWKTDGKIADCLGFMITRIQLDAAGREAERRILPSWAAFNTQSNPDWEAQDMSVWPVQKFTWRDLTLRRSRDTLGVREPDFSVRYEIVPVGKAGPGRAAVPASATAQPGKYKGDPIPLFFCGDPAQTNTLTVSTDVVSANGKAAISAGFTNGILSTQNLRKQLKVAVGQAPSKKLLEPHIKTDKPDPIRRFLTADALPLIGGFMARAKAEDCDLHMALYELNDPELVGMIEANADRVHLILSTAGSTKPPKGSGQKPVWDGTNKDSRKRLRDKVAEFHDRMFNNSGHIGHNKFAVLVDRASKTAKAVLAGSTNWTFTGLCTQSNNVIIMDDPGVAAAYLAYWQRLRDDKLPAPTTVSDASLAAPNNNKQGQGLRTADKTSSDVALAADGKTKVQLWYSPNTTAVSKTRDSPAPPDLDAAFKLMKGAKQAIFFLTFMPSVAGDQSIIVESINDAQAKPDLLVLGAISDGMALPGGDRPASKPSTKKPTTKKTAPGKPAPKKPVAKKPVAKKTAPKRPAAKKTARKTARSGAGKAGPKKTGRASPATRKAKPVKKARGATRTRRTMAMAQRASVVRSARAAQSTRSAKPAKPARPAKPAKPAKPTGTAKSGSSAKAPQPKRAIYTNPKAPKVLMVRAAAIGAFDLIGDWEQEMLKYGQAIIHDKIVVIDPLSDDCVVITGSHNLGYKASYANDENMLIIHGNKALAAAYAVHVLDVYDHYKFRAILEQQAFDRATKGVGEKPKTGQGILQVDDGWQDGYLDGSKGQEGEYFLGATPA